MITAYLNGQRTSPRKMRLIAGLIRGKSASLALDMLSVTTKRAAHPMEKLLKSAIANGAAAGVSADRLMVKEVRVDQGQTLKRMIPGSRGSGFPIKKRTSKVTIVLDEAKAALPKAEKKANKK